MEEAAAIPAVTVVEECDVTEVVATRAAARRPVSYLTFVLKACARALRDHPDLNATFRDGRLERRPVDGIGVAVHTDAGLVVPVVRRVEDRPLGDVDDDITRLAEAARGGRLTPADFEGAAFTVTSPGPLGGLMATPLINAPQVAILGVHRIGPRPVVRADQVVIRTMGNLSITFDHRVIDGVPAARFLLDVIRALEHPGLLLI
jgi:pyruvate/2-oxoglutarate dehydrogenase complex dihydrolipoamide acyltransferase (E2) component